jgi:hypothetical protein
VIRYVTKYVAKPIPPGIASSPELLRELIAALHKKRLCSTFGTWRGIKLTNSGPTVQWIFVGSLATVRSDAARGDTQSQQILNYLHFSAKWIDDPPDNPLLWDQ